MSAIGNASPKKIAAPLTARAEELSLKQWIALANHIAPRDEKFAARASAERFPVVDENDRQIGTSSRLEVHENNFRHRAVHILIFNHSGEILLQKRSPRKDRHPLLWDSSAAGHVEANEDYDEAAVRELMEELALSARLERLGKLAASEKNRSGIHYGLSRQTRWTIHLSVRRDQRSRVLSE